MTTIAPAVLYAMFVWWFTTGLVLLLVLRDRRTVRASLAFAVLLVPVSLYVIAWTSSRTDILGAYVAFSAAIVFWGTQEIAFLTGKVTGPRAHACPPGSAGFARFRSALGAILYHELALLACGATVAAVTWGAPNQIATLTFLILWTMRVSSKLNLFLGVPILNDEIMPQPIAFLRSYFRRGPVSGFFPVSVGAAILGFLVLAARAYGSDAQPFEAIGYSLLTTLMGLAILEHGFMLVSLPLGRLWAWSQARVRRPVVDGTSDRATAEIDHVVATAP